YARNGCKLVGGRMAQGAKGTSPPIDTRRTLTIPWWGWSKQGTELRKPIQEVQVADRVHQILLRRPERAERAQHTRTLQGAAPTHHRDNRGRIVQNDIQLHRQLGRSVVHEAAIKPQEPIQRRTIGDYSSSNLIHSMSLIFQRRHNAKVTATSAQRPKELG